MKPDNPREHQTPVKFQSKDRTTSINQFHFHSTCMALVHRKGQISGLSGTMEYTITDERLPEEN